MKVYEDECVDCGLPCIGSACPLKMVPHWYCDSCGDETDLYDFDGEELCLDCIKERLEKVSA